MNEVSRDSIVIGSYSLETLTTGMYEDPRHCLREYIQNSYDAIRSGRSNGLLEPTEGLVTAAISGPARKPTLTISDNGEGIPSEHAVSTLVSVGASRKRSTTDAGFRGIGRLAGIAYCTTLRFTTTSLGEKTETIVEFDCGQMRSYMRPGAAVQDVREVIRLCTKNYTRAAKADLHGMKVEMVGLVGVGLEFIEIDELIPYLRQIAPVDYTDRFTFAQRIRDFFQTVGSPIGAIELETRFKRERTQILKGYDDSAPTGRGPAKIEDIEFISSNELGWYAWLGKSNFPGVITDDTVAGIRFRLKNIQVGGSEIIEELASELTTGGTESRLQRWAVGEVFITNPSVVPNARRDGFEDSNFWRQIKKDVRTRVAKRVVTVIRRVDRSKKALKSIRKEISNLASQITAQPEDEVKIDELLAATDRVVEKLNADKFPRIDPDEIGELVSKVKGHRDALLEAKGRIKKKEPPNQSEDSTDNGSKEAVASEGDTKNGAETTTEISDEDLSNKALFEALIEVLCAEFGSERMEQLVNRARDKLTAN